MKLWICLLLAGLSLGASHAQQAGATNLWRVSLLDNGTESSPALAPDGTVYQGTFRGWLLAVAPDGQVRWKFQAGREIKSTPAVAPDGTVYFGARDGKVYALTATGKLKWTFHCGAWVDSSPGIAADGTIYFGSWDKFFYALNPDGSFKWKFATSNVIDSSPAMAADGTIYFGSHDRFFYALSPAGKLKWRFATQGEIQSSPALGANGEVYFTATDGYCYALRPDGTELWRLHTGGYTAGSPVLDVTGNVYLTANQACLSISPAGKLRWQSWIIANCDSTPVVSPNGTIYFAVPWHNISASDSEGRQIWNFDTEDVIPYAPTMDEHGVIYAANHQYLLAIQTTTKSIGPAKSSWPMWRGNPQHTGRLAK